jgi:hypothetical protein
MHYNKQILALDNKLKAAKKTVKKERGKYSIQEMTLPIKINDNAMKILNSQ